jgi:hypothetical protein
MAKKFLTPIDLTKLELRNAAIQNLTEDPATPSTGQIYFDTSEGVKQLKIYNGTSWVSVGSSTEQIQDVVGAFVSASTGIRVIYDDASDKLGIENVGILAIGGTTDEVLVNGGTAAVNSASVTLSLPSTINADTTGNAATATKWATARTLSLSGGASGSVSLDGSADVTLSVAIDSESAVSSITGTANEIDVSASVGAVTISLPETINADTTGNAATATALETGRSIGLYGDVSGSVTFNGSADVVINAQIQPDSVALGTDTTGDYVASVSGTANEIEVTGTGEGAAVTVGLPNSVQITDDLTVGGNLTVSGSVVYLNVTELNVEDNTITLNYGATGEPTLDAGIEVARGASPTVGVIWSETNDVWTVTNNGTNYHAIARKFAISVGDNSASAIAVTHNLGTRDVQVQIYTNSASYDTVEADVERTDADTVTVKFAVAPTTNQYRVVVTG